MAFGELEEDSNDSVEVSDEVVAFTVSDESRFEANEFTISTSSFLLWLVTSLGATTVDFGLEGGFTFESIFGETTRAGEPFGLCSVLSLVPPAAVLLIFAEVSVAGETFADLAGEDEEEEDDAGDTGNGFNFALRKPLGEYDLILLLADAGEAALEILEEPVNIFFGW